MEELQKLAYLIDISSGQHQFEALILEFFDDGQEEGHVR
jgi:hypothetical protein